MYDEIFWTQDENIRYNGNSEYCVATCYDIDWGFLLPCKSGVLFEQQTDGCCCNHVWMEGILIVLRDPIEIVGTGKEMKFNHPIQEIPELNYDPPRNVYSKKLSRTWERVRKASAIDFEFIDAPEGMPPNQEGFQWILYHGHEEGHGNSFNINSWKEKPIVLIYPNSD